MSRTTPVDDAELDGLKNATEDFAQDLRALADRLQKGDFTAPMTEPIERAMLYFRIAENASDVGRFILMRARLAEMKVTLEAQLREHHKRPEEVGA